jgi:hypothetical protein
MPFIPAPKRDLVSAHSVGKKQTKNPVNPACQAEAIWRRLVYPV